MKTNQTRLVLLGATDRQFEELLRLSGAIVTVQPLDALGALSHASSSAPDALVIDLRDSLEIPPALIAFRRHHPATGVVIVAARLDPALMLEAMRAGVTEWLAEPIVPAELAEAVQRVLVNHKAKVTLGKVFAFIGAKGGVGTTTSAVNVATALAALAPRRTLLVDLHLAHGDAAVFLGIEPKFSVADALDNIHRMDQAFLRGLVMHSKTGLDLLAAPERPMTRLPDSGAVRDLIECTAQHYDYVVLDAPRSDMTILDSLELASTVVVVANQELATVRRASPLLLTLRQRYGKDRVSVVMSRFDDGAEIRQEDIERVTGTAVRHRIPSDYRLAVDGLNKGQPVVIENHNRLAASFVGLARTLAGLEKHKAGAARSGLFGRFGRRT
jgi:pilus assembly protein CpaE